MKPGDLIRTKSTHGLPIFSHMTTSDAGPDEFVRLHISGNVHLLLLEEGLYSIENSYCCKLLYDDNIWYANMSSKTSFERLFERVNLENNKDE